MNKTAKPLGICERIRHATKQEQLQSLEREFKGYTEASPATRRRVTRLLKQRTSALSASEAAAPASSTTSDRQPRKK